MALGAGGGLPAPSPPALLYSLLFSALRRAASQGPVPPSRSLRPLPAQLASPPSLGSWEHAPHTSDVRAGAVIVLPTLGKVN